MANKRPAEQWYTGDWYRAVDVQKCCPATRGIWRDAIDAMINEQITGKIRGTRDEIKRLLRCNEKELQRFFDDNKEHKFADIKVRKGKITIVCRRLYRKYLSEIGNVRRQRRFRKKGGGDPERWTAIRVLILQRDKYGCAYCGAKAKTVDHIIPRSKGGDEKASNLVACCSRCNLKKNNRTLKEAGMQFWKNFDAIKLQKSPDIVAEMLKECGLGEGQKRNLSSANRDSARIKRQSNADVTPYSSTSSSSSYTYTLQEVLDIAPLVGVDDEKAEQFWNHFNAQGWLRANKLPITDLKSQLVNWRNNEYRFERQTAKASGGQRKGEGGGQKPRKDRTFREPAEGIDI